MNVKKALPSIASFLLLSCSAFALPWNHPAQPTVVDLAQSEKKVYSQNGEDGVLEKIFKTIGVTNKVYVEFGCDGGAESNTRYLREKRGWRGLLMDRTCENSAINLRKAHITAENCDSLFATYKVPEKFDLLSIDIDYNDFYIWKAIKQYYPRVVVIEYNASFLATEDKIVLYNPNYLWDGSNYFGASILAYAKLGSAKGYTLVYAESNGVNLFFIRDDILEGLKDKVVFKNQGNVNELYAPPRYGSGPNGGHPTDPLKREFLPFLQAYTQ